ncbi:MAG TPA: glycoside hydrolase family 38 C-terminal domain-containing protein [Ruminiclostridium sp.]
MHNKYNLYVISHTHWDREWYQTFQAYRKRLVYMVDELIEHMESDKEYLYFHMDGQTIMIEDYLQIRPENEGRLKALISEGRIIIGPWYVMPDEFLVTGESLVRNLQKGFEISRAYGVEPMKNGYVTDVFGHNSQFPQILQGFGIDSALLYRGIGDYPKDAFHWEGADESSVLVLKMDKDRSYSNFYFAIRWPFDGRKYEKEELVSRMKELLKLSGSLAVSDNLLMMDGVDHIEIEPELVNILSVLNENIEEIEIKHSKLEDYITAQKESGVKLDTLQGELYNVGKKGINNQVLKNVLSSMVHIKQMNNECETLLTRWAEPFGAIASYIKPQNTKGFFEEAWKQLIQNHPHDSICGCSITRVHEDNEYRFDQVKDIGQELLNIEFKDIADAINTKVMGKEYAIIIFNGSQQEYKGIVEVELEFPSGSQGNFKIFDYEGEEIPYQLLSAQKGITMGKFEFRKLPEFPQKDLYKVAFLAIIPSLGYNTYGYEEYKTINPGLGDYSYKEFNAPTRYPGSMQTGHKTWENAFLKVTFEDNGTLSVLNKETGKKYRDLLVFEDCADIGDGWNYRKPLKDTRIMSLNSRNDLAIEYEGPLSVQFKLVHSMKLPVKMSETGLERSKDTAEFEIVTYITMKKDSSRLEFHTEVDNKIKEHRLRVMFPNYLATDKFYSSTPFFLQEREIKRLDRHDYVEVETGVFPNQGVVVLKDAENCLALYNKGLYEVEVSEDDSHSIYLTLFRSYKNEVGRTVGEMSFMIRNMSFDYALEFNSGAVPLGEIMTNGETWRTGMKTFCTDAHEGTMKTSQSFIKVSIPGAVLSAFKVKDKDLKIVRLYNCTSEETEGELQLYEVPKKVYILNLNEEITGEVPLNGNIIALKLKPAQIVTIGIK